MKEDTQGIKVCEVCGKTFIPRTKRQRTCASDSCKRLLHKKTQREYESKHPGRNAEREEAKKHEEAKVKAHLDSIIGEGYAERQIADSLRIAGKVRTEL